MTQIGYAKALKGPWMEQDWKFASNKTMQHRKIGLFMQYHDDSWLVSSSNAILNFI
jgi:hypothetical protein